MPEIACVIVSAAGLEAARKLKTHMQCQLHGPISIDDCDVHYDDLRVHLRNLFALKTPIIAICATGIAIRMLAPVIDNKFDDPAVICLAPDGKFVVPLLGGHHSANRLSAQVAECLGATNVTTTQANSMIAALEDPPSGWHIDRVQVDAVIKAAVRGARVVLKNDSTCALWFDWQDQVGSGDEVIVRVSHDEVAALVPKNLILGVGCARNTNAQVLIDHVEAILRQHTISRYAIAHIASVSIKEDEPAIHALAAHLGCAIRWFVPESLTKFDAQVPNPSAYVKAEIGCASVAEASALALSEGRLIVEKCKGDNVTAAIAQMDTVIVPDTSGYARGDLRVVGVGPGDRRYRTGACEQAIDQASDIVGLPGYIALIDDLCAGKAIHEAPLGQEKQRCEMALDLAAQGKRVCLLASGDAGIYALATLVQELLDKAGVSAWRSVQVTCEPGISAFQALASKVGAPVGHDFCLISLSDLLTPFDVVLQRVRGAIVGDFVICIYNPQSKTRRTLLRQVIDLIKDDRGADCVLAEGRNVARLDETIKITTLGQLDVDSIDMFTMLIIGAKQSRSFTHLGNERIYTPRGYLSEQEQ